MTNQIEKRKLWKVIKALFVRADIDGDGKLSREEIQIFAIKD